MNEERRAREDEEREAARMAEEEAEKAAEAAEAARLEAKRKADAEELEKWKHLMSVEGDGSTAAEQEAESQDLLGEFVGYVKNQKVVDLEDIARQFKLRATDV